MDLYVVRLVAQYDPADPATKSVPQALRNAVRPELPAVLDGRWGQASSRFAKESRSLVYVSEATDEELALIEAQEDVERVGRVSSAEEDADMRRGLREVSPNWAQQKSLADTVLFALANGVPADDPSLAAVRRVRAGLLARDFGFHDAVKREWRSAYETAVQGREEAQTRKEAVARAVTLGLWLGATVAIGWLSHALKLPYMAATTLYLDGFGRLGDLDGTSTETGGGTWGVDGGTGFFATAAGVCGTSAAGSFCRAGIADMTPRAAMRVSAVFAAYPSFDGAIARYSGGSASSGIWARGDLTNFTVYLDNAGSFTLLGTGSAMSGTPTLGVDLDSGSGIDGYFNGVVDIPGLSDSTFSSGSAGLTGFGLGGAFDDFLVEIPAAPAASVGGTLATMGAG